MNSFTTATITQVGNQSKKGLWHNFETGESGDLITLLQKDKGLTFSETLEYASSVFGDFQNAKISRGSASRSEFDSQTKKTGDTSSNINRTKNAKERNRNRRNNDSC